MANVEDSAARAAATGGGGDQKGRIPKILIILPSAFPANTWLFFRQVNPTTLAERYVHWLKLPQFDKEIPVPCMANAVQHAQISSWTVPDICPMCKWAVDKDPRQVVNRFDTSKPNIQHQWSWKVNPLTPIRDAQQKITGQTINPNVHLLQVTQSTLFKAIVAAKDDPELPAEPPLSQRSLKLYKGLEPGKEAKDTKYQAAYSQSVLPSIPDMIDALPTEDDIEKVWTADEFAAFLNTTPKPKDSQGAPAQGQQAPAGAGGQQQGGGAPPKKAADDGEF